MLELWVIFNFHFQLAGGPLAAKGAAVLARRESMGAGGGGGTCPKFWYPL